MKIWKHSRPIINWEEWYLRQISRLFFHLLNLRFTRSLIADPALLDMPIQKQSFNFKGTPIKEVFAALENSYGVKILFDAEVMKNCYLTASLSDEPLFEKIDLICRTINATHEQLDASIIIYEQRMLLSI